MGTRPTDAPVHSTAVKSSRLPGCWSPAVRGWLLPVLWAGLALACGIRAAVGIPDDMFITFRYAWNLAHGEGLVFNPGERVFGLTNPGHALVLALLHGATRIPVPVLAACVFGLALWSLAVMLWREGHSRGMAGEAALGGTLVLGASFVWLAIGSESAPVLALLAAAAVLIHRRPLLSGLLAGLAVWYRPDALLGIAALGLLAWWERRRLPWRWAAVTGGLVVLGLGAAWLWFGSFLPHTLEAKQVAAEADADSWIGPLRFWTPQVRLMPRHFGGAWVALATLGLVGQAPLLAGGGIAVRTVALYGAGVLIAYPLLGVPLSHWYAVPPIVALLLGVGALGGWAGRRASGWLTARAAAAGRGPSPRSRTAVAVATASLLLAVPVASYGLQSAHVLRHMRGGTHYSTLREVGRWIGAHSLPHETIAYGEIGNLGYWSRRPLHDLMGLVTPAVVGFLAVNDSTGAFLSVTPDFFVDHSTNPHPGIVAQPWFQDAYEPVARIDASLRRREAATVYRRRPGAELPAPTYSICPLTRARSDPKPFRRGQRLDVSEVAAAAESRVRGATYEAREVRPGMGLAAGWARSRGGRIERIVVVDQDRVVRGAGAAGFPFRSVKGSVDPIGWCGYFDLAPTVRRVRAYALLEGDDRLHRLQRLQRIDSGDLAGGSRGPVASPATRR